MGHRVAFPRLRPRTMNLFDSFFFRRVFAPSGLPHGVTGGRPPDAFPLTPSQGMVHRVHGHATNLRTASAPTAGTGLSQRLKAMVHVADLAHRGEAAPVDPAHLGGGKSQSHVFTLLRYDLHTRPGGTGHLTTLARLHLHVVDGRTPGESDPAAARFPEGCRYPVPTRPHPRRPCP